jgi:hypothetical protein
MCVEAGVFNLQESTKTNTYHPLPLINKLNFEYKKETKLITKHQSAILLETIDKMQSFNLAIVLTFLAGVSHAQMETCDGCLATLGTLTTAAATPESIDVSC